MHKDDTLLFPDFAPREIAAAVSKPEGYTGLYGFHKYWGKKPREIVSYLVEQLTDPGDIVLDPFVGSGPAAREALLASRRFVGFDINPIAIELTKLLAKPPRPRPVRDAIAFMKLEVQREIENSYLLEDGKSIATHYLWNADQLTQVWTRGASSRRRLERPPTNHDHFLSASFDNYKSSRVQMPRFFTNARINAAPCMTLSHFMTGRAQRNIDLILSAIGKAPPEIRPALSLCLTAASGQMTKMVFAVTSRGKTKGREAERVEVGSWVIGYWRPKLHFEVNSWTCFERRLNKLQNATRTLDALSSTRFSSSWEGLATSTADAYLACGDSRVLIKDLPDSSISLVITDPPHSDRVPYLELSEFWNSILGIRCDFENEIVVSNAKERNKTSAKYQSAMHDLFRDASRVLKPSGSLVILFNAGAVEEWEFIHRLITSRGNTTPSVAYVGNFECKYSASSVVQDNREGSFKNDFALVFARDPEQFKSHHAGKLEKLASWSVDLPHVLKTSCNQ